MLTRCIELKGSVMVQGVGGGGGLQAWFWGH